MISLFSLLIATTEAVPIQMTHQGRLLDNNGAAETGLHLLSFTIYDAETGGSNQWTETLAVQFNNGYYATVLGSDEQNNPLDSSTLEFYPLYLEITVDQGTPLSPRNPILSVPYSQISGLAEQAVSLDGGSVNATDIQISGQAVVDSGGNWVGPTINVLWSDIDTTTLPNGLNDGDDDTLGNISCNPSEIVTWSGASWVCTSDSRLTLSDVTNQLQNNPSDFHIDSTLGGIPILTTVDDADTLASLSCISEEIPVYDAVLNAWVCGTQSILQENDVEAFIENDPINLADNSTMNGQVLITAPPNCSNGQILSFDGNNNAWICIDFSSALDVDGDGVFAWLDCDDNDSTLLNQNNDADCDGFETNDDCDDTTNTIGDSGTGTSPDCLAESCLSILTAGYSTGDGLYYIDINGNSESVYCDMTTDNGGWSIFYAATGANTEVILTSDSIRNGNPLSFQHHNLSRTTKVALSSTATETLFNSNSGTWIKSDSPAFSSALLNTNEHDHTSVTLTANNGVTASGFQGWSNFNIAGGGDFNLSMTNGSTCSGTTTNGLDHHSGTYYHLNCGCQRHYLYSYSASSLDSDAGYDVSVGLGSWGATAACNSAEGGSLQFYVGVR